MNFKSPSSRHAHSPSLSPPLSLSLSLAICVTEFWWISSRILIGFQMRPVSSLGKQQHFGASPLRRYLRRFLIFYYAALILALSLSLSLWATTTTDYRIPHTGKARRRSTGAGSNDTNGAVQVAASQSAGTIEPGIDMESCGHCTQRDICLWTGMAKW